MVSASEVGIVRAQSFLIFIEAVTSHIAWASGAAFGIYLGLARLGKTMLITKPETERKASLCVKVIR